MISAVTAGKPKVIGSSIAMVAVGPMPGSAPTVVPSTTPTNPQKRFSGVSAVANPSWRFSSRFMGWLGAAQPWPDQRQAQLEGEDEDRHAHDRQAGGDSERPEGPGPLA